MRPAVAWFVPDLALVTAIVTLFYCLFLFQGYQKLFRDSDAGWHIRTGEAVLATGRLPRTDPFSFSRPGQPWFAWEWGADVVVGAIHHGAGLPGVALFYGGVIAAGVWLWFQLQWTMRGDFLVACAMAPLLLSTCDIHWLARPHVIGWLFLLGAVLYAEIRGQSTQSPKTFGWRDGLAIGLYMAFWANMHASFFLGAVIAGIYALGRARSAAGIWFAWAAVVAAIAPLANPYGWHLYSHVFRYLTDSELLSRIGEFQSFDFHTPGAGQIIATVILGISGGALALTRKRYEHFLLAMLVSVLALRSARALPMAALLLLPVANAAIRATFDLPWRGYAGTTPRPGLAVEGACPGALRDASGVWLAADSASRLSARRFSGGSLAAHPRGSPFVRPGQVWRLPDLSLQWNPRSLFRRAQRFLRRRIPEAVFPHDTGATRVATVLGVLPLHPRAHAPRLSARPGLGTDRLAASLPGQHRHTAGAGRNLRLVGVLKLDIGRISEVKVCLGGA